MRTPVSNDFERPMMLSVVVPCRNGAKTIGRQLEALCAQHWPGPWEVIVSDNGSTDTTRSVVEAFGHRLPALRVIDSSDRRGAAHARNVGASEARGDALLFCDDDDEVGQNWLAALGNALRTHDFVAARLDRARLNAGAVQRPDERGDGLLDTVPPFLPYAFSAALAVWRPIHLAVGGFDESFVDSCEDRDYCYRLQRAGHQLRLASEALVHYQLPHGLRDTYRRARSYGRGNVQLYRKYRSAGLQRPSQAKAVAGWCLLGPQLLPALRSRHLLTLWLQRLGWRVGRLQGSFQHRVLAL